MVVIEIVINPMTRDTPYTIEDEGKITAKIEHREIIDWESKGNVVRFYLGKNGKQTGDDWNDAPYEHNAGKVYDEFIEGFIDVNFGFDETVVEPCTGVSNSPYSKEDMIKRKVPCIVVGKMEWWEDTFEKVLADSNSKKFYFGDAIDSYLKEKEA